MNEFTPAEVREMKRKLGVNSAAQRAAGTFSPAAHVHATADVNGLDARLANTPVLDDDNTFDGLITAAQVHATTDITTDGTIGIEEGTIDATLLTAVRGYQLPDVGGVLLVDAPSDGKYYVRKDGAWVEIVP